MNWDPNDFVVYNCSLFSHWGEDCCVSIVVGCNAVVVINDHRRKEVKQGCRLNALYCQNCDDCNKHCLPRFFLVVTGKQFLDGALVNLLEV